MNDDTIAREEDAIFDFTKLLSKYMIFKLTRGECRNCINSELRVSVN